MKQEVSFSVHITTFNNIDPVPSQSSHLPTIPDHIQFYYGCKIRKRKYLSTVVDPNRLCSDPVPGSHVHSDPDPDPVPDSNSIRIYSYPDLT